MAISSLSSAYVSLSTMRTEYAHSVLVPSVADLKIVVLRDESEEVCQRYLALVVVELYDTLGEPEEKCKLLFLCLRYYSVHSVDKKTLPSLE